MKKRFNIILILIIMFSPIFVFAQDYQVKQLIPVDSEATVNTDKFNYQGFKYNSTLDSKGNTKITFNSIQNNMHTSQAVSINVLLFGEDQKNIGIVTYCSNKDYGNTYEGFKLRDGQSAPFSINVVSKYFIDGKSPRDVKYIAVLDENKYCRVGGYDNYAGLTIDEIVNGVNPKEDGISLTKYTEFLSDPKLKTYLIYGVIILVVILVISVVIKKLGKRRGNFVIKKEVTSNDEDTSSNFIDNDSDKVLDLSYDNADDVSLGNINDANIFDISSGDASNEVKNSDDESLIEENTQENVSNSENNEEKEDESDLSKFFG